MRNLAHWMLALASLLALNADAADGFNAEDWKHRQKTLIDTTAEGVELKQGASQLPLHRAAFLSRWAILRNKSD